MKVTPATQTLPEAEQGSESTTDEEEWVRCAACAARLAPARARIEVNGAHEHEFMNPTGMRFVVACFAMAPGCAPEGERSTVWTWFPGRSWQIELCKQCTTHVGWSFHASETASFYGLVRDRIA